MMKNILLLSMLPFVIGCVKNNTEQPVHEIRYLVEGTNVTEFKFSSNNKVHEVQTPFTGIRDTIIHQVAGSALSMKVESKGEPGAALSAKIYVNGSVLMSRNGVDRNNDGTSQILIETVLY